MSALSGHFSKNSVGPIDADAGMTIVLIDDDPFCLDNLKMACAMVKLDDQGPITTIECDNIEDALQVLSNHSKVHVLLLDKDLSKTGGTNANGIAFIPEFLKLQPQLRIIMITSSGEKDDIVEAMSLGACNYVTKRETLDVMAAAIGRALLDSLTLMRALRVQARHNPVKIEIVGQSSANLDYKRRLRAFAQSDAPVLIEGPLGTGKTVSVQFINQERALLTGQVDRPFVSENIAAIPKDLISSTFFGHKKGSFTNAYSDGPGLLLLSNGGTLHLDEIGELPLEYQAVLLRALEEGRFYPVGAKTPVKVRFKLVCTTNRNLEEMVEQGLFREDLYSRISTLAVKIPTLLETIEDMPEYLRILLPDACTQANIPFMPLTQIPSDIIQYLKDNPPRDNLRGVKSFMTALFTESPKDKIGKPILTNWRRTLKQFYKKRMGFKGRVQTEGAGPITIDELSMRPFSMMDSDFLREGGIESMYSLVAYKLIEEASKKVKQKQDQGALLGLDRYQYSRLLTKLKNFSHPSVKVKGSDDTKKHFGQNKEKNKNYEIEDEINRPNNQEHYL